MIIFITLLTLGLGQVDPVDKLQEFQKLMQSKVKVPKKNAIEYDSSDIFSDGYTTEEIIDIGSDEMMEEEIQESDHTEELLRLAEEQQKLEEQLRLEEERKEQKKKQQELLKLQKQQEQEALEQQLIEKKLIEEVKEKKKSKKIIQLSEWSDDDEEDEQVIIMKPKKKKRTQLQTDYDEQLLQMLAKKQKKNKVQLDDLNSELLSSKSKKKNQAPPPPPPPVEEDYDYEYYDDDDEEDFLDDDDEEFIQKVPVQQQTFIKFNNQHNLLDLAPCSNNPIQQRACSLCKTEVGYQLDDDNWYMIGLQHGYQKEFLMLLEMTKQLLGDSQLYLSFSSNNHVCLTSDSLKSKVDVESVLHKFADNSLKHFIKTDLFGIENQMEGQSFQFRTFYQNKQFQFQNFQIQFAANIVHEKPNALIKITSISFNVEDLQVIYKGQVNELPFEMVTTNGDMKQELSINNCQIPQHNDLIISLSDIYFGQYFRESLLNKLKNQTFRADLIATADHSESKLKIKLQLKKK